MSTNQKDINAQLTMFTALCNNAESLDKSKVEEVFGVALQGAGVVTKYGVCPAIATLATVAAAAGLTAVFASGATLAAAGGMQKLGLRLEKQDHVVAQQKEFEAQIKAVKTQLQFYGLKPEDINKIEEIARNKGQRDANQYIVQHGLLGGAEHPVGDGPKPPSPRPRM